MLEITQFPIKKRTVFENQKLSVFSLLENACLVELCMQGYV